MGYRWIAENERVPCYGKAIANNINRALKGEYPNITIDYPKVILSTGSLQLSGISTFMMIQDRELHFTWTVSGEHRNAHLMLLAYCPQVHEAIYELCGAKHMTGFEKLTVPMYWTGKQVETYLSFVEEQGRGAWTVFIPAGWRFE